MEAEYRRNLSHSYLILKEKGEREEDSYEMKILAANRIEGLLPVTAEHVNDEIRYRYDVSGLKPFEVFCERRRFRAEDLCGMFGGLLDLTESAEAYLLDEAHLLLDPDYLYVSWDTGRIWVPYYPMGHGSVRQGLTDITEYLLRKTGHGDHACVLLACRFLHALQEPDLRAGTLRQILEEGRSIVPSDTEAGFGEADDEETAFLFGEPSVRDVRGSMDFPEDEVREGASGGERRKTGRQYLPERETLYRLAVLGPLAAGMYAVCCLQRIVLLNGTEQTALACAFAAAAAAGILLPALFRGGRKEKAGREPAYSSEETFLTEREDAYDPDEQTGLGWYEDREEREMMPDTYTVPLSDVYRRDSGELWELVPEEGAGTTEIIPLRGTEILIGQKGGPGDCVIADETVSRIHARLFRRGGVWYVCDMNSRNGTTADGKKAAGLGEIPLVEGSRISFARCSYVLRRKTPPVSAIRKPEACEPPAESMHLSAVT